MSPVTRFSEATRNGLGGRAELERAVELEEKMEQFVDSLNETLFCVTFGDLLSRLSGVVDLARQHMEKEGEEESPSTEPLPPVVLQVVKTEYGECSKGCGAAAKDVEVCKVLAPAARGRQGTFARGREEGVQTLIRS